MWKELCDIMYVSGANEFFEDYIEVFLKSFI